MPRRKPKCFVIMPFGEKPVGNELVDFDFIWSEFIEKAGIAAGFNTERADTRPGTGHISSAMIKRIYEADVAVADVTYHNPNVFYELGIRHALARHGTVLIKRLGGDLAVVPSPVSDPTSTEIPFDTKDVVHLMYELTEATLKAEIEKLSQAIVARQAARDSDSPVYMYLPELRFSTKSTPSPGRYDRTYAILDEDGNPTGKLIGYRSGDIANMTVDSGNTIDYWVNSENTLMQMARIYERSFSSTVRYLGAHQPDPELADYDDTIQVALTEALQGRSMAQPGEILVTTSGRLKETHGVRALLHAATVTGQPRRGFAPISTDRAVECVGHVIRTAREVIKDDPDPSGPRSVILPLFGTGQARTDPLAVAAQLVSAAIDALEGPGPDLGDRDLTTVLFSAFTVDDVNLMRRLCEAFAADGMLQKVTSA